MGKFGTYRPSIEFPTKPLYAKENFVKSMLGVFGFVPLRKKLPDTVNIDRIVLQENIADNLIQALSIVCPMDDSMYVKDKSSSFANMNYYKIIYRLRSVIEDLYKIRKNPTNIHHHFPKCKGGWLDKRTNDENNPIFNMMYNEGKVKIRSNTSEINKVIHSYIHIIFGESLIKEKLLFILNNEKDLIYKNIYKDTFEVINDIFSGSKWGGYKPEALNPCDTLKKSLGLTSEDICELENIHGSFHHNNITSLIKNDLNNPYIGLPIKGIFDNAKLPDAIEGLIQSTNIADKKDFLYNLLSLYKKYNKIS